jgi:hypothetical protein
MTNQVHPADALKDIRSMMERSSRFISLSGLSGIAAGICALVGAYIAYVKLDYGNLNEIIITTTTANDLIVIGIVTFLAAFVSAFLFTYLRSKKTGVPVWGTVAKRVIVSVALPMIVGGVLVLRLLDAGLFVWIAPMCLLFYGLGLLNASKYTFTEIKYLAYLQLALGLMNLWMLGYGLYFWVIGFGILHIIYGIIMWSRYERAEK